LNHGLTAAGHAFSAWMFLEPDVVTPVVFKNITENLGWMLFRVRERDMCCIERAERRTIKLLHISIKLEIVRDEQSGQQSFQHVGEYL
jgi:hypothetical protein